MTTQRHPDLEPAQDQRAETPLIEDASGDDLASFVDALPTDSSVTVRASKRKPGASGPGGWTLCGEFPVDGFDPWAVREAFGPGVYRFDAVLREEGKRARYLSRKHAEFAQPVAMAGAPVMPVMPTPPPPAVDVGTNQLVQILLAQNQQSNQLLATVLTAVLGRPMPAGPSISDMAALVKLGQESNTRAVTPAAEIMQALTTGIELARDSDAGSGGGESNGSTLERLAPKFLDLIGNLAQKPATVPAPAPPAPVHRMPPPPLPAPAPNPPAVAAPPVVAEKAGAPPVADDPRLALLKRWAGQIYSAASSNRDPGLWGNFVADNAPDSVLPDLADLANLERSERMELLTAADPRLAPFADWIDAACAGILEILEAETGDDLPADDPTGDSTN